MTEMDEKTLKTPDPLTEEIRQLKASDPAPQLSGVAKAAILEAAAANASSTSLAARLNAWIGGFSGGLETLLRPVSVGTLGLAGIAGVVAGGVLTSAPAAYAELTPEEELASHYEFALTGSGFYDQQLDEEIF